MDDVDYSQRTADGPGGDHVESVVRLLRQVYPHGFRTSGGDNFQVTWGDELAEKRLRDLLRDSAAGRESPADEDQAMARLRQESEEKPWNQGAFFGDIGEMKKYGRPKKL